MTLADIYVWFHDYRIYILDEGTITEFVVIVDVDGYVFVTFERIDDLYQVYDTNYDKVRFASVALSWGDTVTEL